MCESQLEQTVRETDNPALDIIVEEGHSHEGPYRHPSRIINAVYGSSFERISHFSDDMKKAGPVGKLFVGAVYLYRVLLYPLSHRFGDSCRFEPSCSEYMVQSIQKKGVIKGIRKGIGRILRCNPLFEGGYDPVEPDEEPKAI